MNTENIIEFSFEDVDIPDFDQQKVTDWILDTIRKEDLQPGVLNIIFCNDDYLLELNKTYLDHHTLTDIITFDYNDEMEGISGDIFISVERVEDNSREYDCSFHEELNRVIIHGVLHLMGYKDKDPEDKAIMREKENYYLTLLS